jgi:hypothetical protein
MCHACNYISIGALSNPTSCVNDSTSWVGGTALQADFGG